MNTKQEAQELFDVLTSSLTSMSGWSSHYVTRKHQGLSQDQIDTMKKPIEWYLDSLKRDLRGKNFQDNDEAFFREVYLSAFRTGPIPKNRNHIAMDYKLQVDSRPMSSALKYWLDLDYLATQVNTHLNTCNSFAVKLGAGSSDGSSSMNGHTIRHSSHYATNSIQNPNQRSTDLLLGSFLLGMLSGYALLIASLALLSIYSLSTAGIVTAIGVSVLSAAASYGLFKAKDASYAKTNTGSIIENATHSAQLSLDELFEQHFAPTLGEPILSEAHTPVTSASI